MDTNPDKKPIDQLPEFVEQVQSLVIDAQDTLKNLPKLEGTPESADSLRALLETYADKEQQIAEVGYVFLAWDAEELPAYEKSEVERALGLLKRAKLVASNILRLLKKELDIPDPERAQMELQMKLQSMGAIHGAPR